MKKINFTAILIIFLSTIAFSQINIEIGDGMTVETSGGVYISGASEVTENGTGYLKGTVESASLSGATQFAGLTLSNGFTGTITRTTGSAFSSSNPKTAFRSYKMDNSGSAITADVEAEIITAPANNEENSITDKFIYTEDGAASYLGYTDNGSDENTIKAAGVDIPSGTSNILISEGVGVAAKIFLEGPYSASSDIMSNSLAVPANSPYTEAPRTASVPAGAVDWVLVELRSGTGSGTSLGYRSAFIDQNGNLINDSGSPVIGLPAIPGNRYLVIRHRNHLPVMSSTDHVFNWFSAP